MFKYDFGCDGAIRHQLFGTTLKSNIAVVVKEIQILIP